MLRKDELHLQVMPYYKDSILSTAQCFKPFREDWIRQASIEKFDDNCESESEIIISLSPRGFSRLIYNSLWGTLAGLLLRSLQFMF